MLPDTNQDHQFHNLVSSGEINMGLCNLLSAKDTPVLHPDDQTNGITVLEIL